MLNREIIREKVVKEVTKAAWKLAKAEARGYVQAQWLKENESAIYLSSRQEEYLKNAEHLGYDETDFVVEADISTHGPWFQWFFFRLKNEILGKSEVVRLDFPDTAKLPKAFILPLLQAEKLAHMERTLTEQEARIQRLQDENADLLERLAQYEQE